MTDRPASDWLAAEFSTRLRQVLESMSGETLGVEYQAGGIAPADLEGLLWWEQPLSLSADSRLWIGIHRENCQALGARLLRAAGVEDADQETARSTFREIVTQTSNGIAAAVASRVGREISCLAGQECAPSLAYGPAFSFRIVFPDAETPILAVFADSLANLPEPPADPPPNSIDLLLDVELRSASPSVEPSCLSKT